MRLPSQDALVLRSERIWEHIAAFAAGRTGDPLVWCNLPRLGSTAYVHMAEPHRVPRELSRGEMRSLQAAQVSARRRGPGRGALVGDRCLFLVSASDRRGAQAALHERFGPLRAPDPPIGSSRRRALRLSRGAAALAGELIACARRNQIEYPLDSSLVHRQIARAARLLGYWEDLLDREAPRVVVVPSLWAPPARALIHTAREAGIPTVHLPDGALRADWRRPGLPVDYAALRGPQEAAYVARQGVDRGWLDVIGHPAIAPRRVPEVDSSLAPVFAPGSERRSQLAPLVALVHDALGDHVVVGRHPNPSADRAQPSFPAGWRIADGRTYALLERGSPLVVQQSSGVALESMQLGIPVIELRYPGKATHLPWLREPYVRFASTSAELRTAVAAAHADAADPARRRALVEWARGWAWPTGAQAAERAVALVERALAEGSRGPIWDPWEQPPSPPSAR